MPRADSRDGPLLPTVARRAAVAKGANETLALLQRSRSGGAATHAAGTRMRQYEGPWMARTFLSALGSINFDLPLASLDFFDEGSGFD